MTCSHLNSDKIWEGRGNGDLQSAFFLLAKVSLSANWGVPTVPLRLSGTNISAASGSVQITGQPNKMQGWEPDCGTIPRAKAAGALLGKVVCE